MANLLARKDTSPMVDFTVEKDNRVSCSIALFFDDTTDCFIAELIDEDHQSIIEILDAIWPNWTDQQQWLLGG